MSVDEVISEPESATSPLLREFTQSTHSYSKPLLASGSMPPCCGEGMAAVLDLRIDHEMKYCTLHVDVHPLLFIYAFVVVVDLSVYLLVYTIICFRTHEGLAGVGDGVYGGHLFLKIPCFADKRLTHVTDAPSLPGFYRTTYRDKIQLPNLPGPTLPSPSTMRLPNS